jgi:hypothetical protein
VRYTLGDFETPRCFHSFWRIFLSNLSQRSPATDPVGTTAISLDQQLRLTEISIAPDQ